VLVSPFSARLRALRRDVAMVAGALVGKTPPPVVRTTLRRAAPAAAPRADAPRAMRVRQVVRETADAVSLVLEDVAGRPVSFAAGQFFTLCARLPGGQVARRAYSASSAPLDGPGVRVTVKRVEGGVVSTALVNAARAGDVIDVLGPSGSFTVPAAAGARRVVLVGGGSGITPLLSIARTLLATEPATHVTLVYGNRSRDDVIFHDVLAELAAEHAGRLVVRNVLERPPPGWTGGAGLLDGHALGRELDWPEAATSDTMHRRADGAPGADALYFLCGPAPMMAAARAWLEARGVPAASIREERFVSAHATAAPSGPQTVRVRLAGATREVLVPAGRTVLESALDARVDMPFSCTVGGCGACRVRLVEGDLAMDEPSCLSPEERARGYVLACVARPRSACTLEVE